MDIVIYIGCPIYITTESIEINTNSNIIKKIQQYKNTT